MEHVGSQFYDRWFKRRVNVLLFSNKSSFLVGLLRSTGKFLCPYQCLREEFFIPGCRQHRHMPRHIPWRPSRVRGLRSACCPATHARTHAHTRTHACTHARTHTRTHTHTHTHTHMKHQHSPGLLVTLVAVASVNRPCAVWRCVDACSHPGLQALSV